MTNPYLNPDPDYEEEMSKFSVDDLLCIEKFVDYVDENASPL